ncbi:MAG: CTP synthase [Bacillota bacterium]
MVKFIFITGGVVSGLGKGITAASLGLLLRARGMEVTALKFDPYVNVDAGTMNPLQHGEVYVTADGGETDLDLGHYERFLGVELGRINNVTTGSIYEAVISRERKGDFLGGTVQIVPHVTNEIKDRIWRVARHGHPQVVLVEVGGTVGDIESLPFLEAIRQFAADVGREHVLFVHVTLVPYLAMSGEQKTKPTQHSVAELRSLGIQPDLIVCRSEQPLSREVLDKVALFCNIHPDAGIPNTDARSIYQVPLQLEAAGAARVALKHLGLPSGQPDLGQWQALVRHILEPRRRVRIALVGKYVGLHDAYLSINEALVHAGVVHEAGVDIDWIDAEELDQAADVESYLERADGILVPGAFGYRGIEGKIKAVRYAREHRVPAFGICMGLQCMVMEFARNVLGLEGANSTEFDPTCEHPVVDIMPGQKSIVNLGGTMRLGTFPCRLVPGSLAARAYRALEVGERHRHRYEVNNHYVEDLRRAGLVPSGTWVQAGLVEIMELRDHPWFLGTQFHPEFRSRPDAPHPLFAAFLGAACHRREA